MIETYIQIPLSIEKRGIIKTRRILTLFYGFKSLDSVLNLAFDWLMRHLPWCMLRCNRIYLHRRNGGLSMFVYQYFSIIFVLFRCFIYFTLNQLYRYTPFKVNETWCTHTETHFFCEIWMKLEENCFFNACFYHSL